TTAAFSWDTTASANGSYTLEARSYDAAGNVGASTPVSVSVNNLAPTPDTVPPSVVITAPNSGVTVVRNTKVYVTASDNVAATEVDLLVDGKLYSTSYSAMPVFTWNTSKISRG